MLDFYIAQPTKNVSDIRKARISEIVASADFQLLMGGSEELISTPQVQKMPTRCQTQRNKVMRVLIHDHRHADCVLCKWL